MPVLSTLSPELDKENEKVQEHSVTSAIREAAMLLMATPLLIDGMMPQKGRDRNGSWVRIINSFNNVFVRNFNFFNFSPEFLLSFQH